MDESGCAMINRVFKTRSPAALTAVSISCTLIVLGVFLVACGSCTSEPDPGIDDPAFQIPETVPVMRSSPRAWNFRFSPDGNTVCFWDTVGEGADRSSSNGDSEHCALFVSGLDGRDRRRLIEPVPCYRWGSDRYLNNWSPGGDLIAFCWPSDDKTIMTTAPDAGEARVVFTMPERTGLSDMTWSPDGRNLAVLLRHFKKNDEEDFDKPGECSLNVLRRDGGAAISFEGMQFDLSLSSEGASWSPDGDTIAVCTGLGLYLCDPAENEASRVYRPSNESGPSCWRPLSPPRWSFDGKKVLVYTWRSIFFYDVAARSCREVPLPGDRTRGAVWIPSSHDVLALVSIEVPNLVTIAEHLLTAGHGQRQYRHLPVVVKADSGAIREISELEYIDERGAEFRLERIPRIGEAFSLWSR